MFYMIIRLFSISLICVFLYTFFSIMIVNFSEEILFNSLSFKDIYTLFFYYLPHGAISSLLIFFSVLLYKRKNKIFNNKLNNDLKLKSIKYISCGIIFIVTIIFFSFVFNEWFSSNLSFSNWNYEVKKLEKAKLQSDKIIYKNKLMKVINEIRMSNYSRANHILNDLISKVSDRFIAIYLSHLVKHLKLVEDDLNSKTFSKIVDFDIGINFFINKNYHKAIKYFIKHKKYYMAKFYLNKIKNIFSYKAIKDKKIRENFNLQNLLLLGKKAFQFKVSNKTNYLLYLVKLNDIFSNNSLLIKKLSEEGIELVFLGKERLVRENFKKSDKFLESNIYFYDENLQLVSKNLVQNLGKTFVIINAVFINEGNIFLKDILLLSNTKNDKKKSDIYFIDYARWNYDRLFIFNYSLKKISSDKFLNFFSVLNKSNTYKHLKMSRELDFNQLIYFNKIMKYLPWVSFFELYSFFSNFDDINRNYKNIFLLGKIIYSNKFSYYLTSILLLLIFFVISFIFRSNYEKPSNLVSIILASLLFMTLSFISFIIVQNALFLIII